MRRPAPTRSPRSANTTAPTSIRPSNRNEIGGASGRFVRRQHREFGLGPPAALREDAIARHAFVLHADLLHHAEARVVVDRNVGGNAIETEVAEAEGEDAAGELGAVTAAAVGVR